jgi:hypothetical protein
VNQSPEYLYKNCFVCGEHFESQMFLNDLKNRLQPTAVPTLINVNNPPQSVFPVRKKRVAATGTEEASLPKIKRCRLSTESATIEISGM